MWPSLEAQNVAVWPQQGFFLKGKEATIVNSALIKIWAFYFKDSLNRNSSSILEVETLHLNMSLQSILLPSLPLLTQCSTWQVFHITRLLFNLIFLRLPSLGDLLPTQSIPSLYQGKELLHPHQRSVHLTLSWCCAGFSSLQRSCSVQLGSPCWGTWELEMQIYQAEKEIVSLFYLYLQLSFTAVIISVTPISSLPPD